MKYCKKCGSDSFVVDSRLRKDGCVIRRRMCQNCGFRWSTIEVNFDWYIKTIKEEGGEQSC